MEKFEQKETLIRIKINSENKIFGGDTINGVVQVRIGNSVGSKLKLRIYGSEITDFRKKNTARVPDGVGYRTKHVRKMVKDWKGRKKYKTVKQKEKYTKYKTVTSYQDAKGKYSIYSQEVDLIDKDLEVGDYEIPFSILVPSDIIGSFHYKDKTTQKEAECSHSIVAENTHCSVKQKLVIFERKSDEFKALRKPDLTFPPKGFCWETKKPMELSFNFNDEPLDQGSKSKTGACLDVSMEVNAHGEEKDIEKIELEIRQYLAVYGHEEKTGIGLGEMNSIKNFYHTFRKEQNPSYFMKVIEGKIRWKVALSPEVSFIPLFYSTIQGRLIRSATKAYVKVHMKEKCRQSARTSVAAKLSIANEEVDFKKEEEEEVVAENLEDFANFNPEILPVVSHSLVFREKLPPFLYDKNDLIYWFNSAKTPVALKGWEKAYEMSEEALQVLPEKNEVQLAKGKLGEEENPNQKTETKLLSSDVVEDPELVNLNENNNNIVIS